MAIQGFLEGRQGKGGQGLSGRSQSSLFREGKGGHFDGGKRVAEFLDRGETGTTPKGPRGDDGWVAFPRGSEEGGGAGP